MATWCYGFLCCSWSYFNVLSLRLCEIQFILCCLINMIWLFCWMRNIYADTWRRKGNSTTRSIGTYLSFYTWCLSKSNGMIITSKYRNMGYDILFLFNWFESNVFRFKILVSRSSWSSMRTRLCILLNLAYKGSWK